MDNPPPLPTTASALATSSRHNHKLEIFHRWFISTGIQKYNPALDGSVKFDPTMLTVLARKLIKLFRSRPFSFTTAVVVYSLLIGLLSPQLWTAHGAFAAGFSSLALGDDLARSVMSICKDGEKVNGATTSTPLNLSNFWTGMHHLSEGQYWMLWLKFSVLQRSSLLFLDSLNYMAAKSNNNTYHSKYYMANAKWFEGMNGILLSLVASYASLRFADNRWHNYLPKYIELFLYASIGFAGVRTAIEDRVARKTPDKLYDIQNRLGRIQKGMGLLFLSYVGWLWFAKFGDYFLQNIYQFTNGSLSMRLIGRTIINLSVSLTSMFLGVGAASEGLKELSMNFGDRFHNFYLNFSNRISQFGKRYEKELAAICLSLMKGVGLYSFFAGGYHFSRSFHSFMQRLTQSSDSLSNISLRQLSLEMGKDVASVVAMVGGYFTFATALSFSSPAQNGILPIDKANLNLSVCGFGLLKLGAALSKFQYQFNEKLLRQSLFNSLPMVSKIDEVLSYENIALTFASTGTLAYGVDMLRMAYKVTSNPNNIPQLQFNPTPGGVALASSLGLVTLKHFLSLGQSVVGCVKSRNVFASVTDLGFLLPAAKDLAFGVAAMAGAGFVLMKTFPSLETTY
ncbi:hypothetical protein FDP41_007204 [Naegleria fowleri]|uniref:Uncharacterized protein n=1 Tax=Naegleria fowleri TaxID=5763 RepID=A0A6A5B8W7_NAEFO|nr:uncharacterized protein FDP41_007204 [Naegleria fowleri]KAF0973817.1 hypothetical protein FDP41_007204 [Naegleria fowleri]